MVTAATDMTGWWVGYAIGVLVVLIVVVVVVAIIVTARKIGDVAEDATRALKETRDRTEVLWQVATTNIVANDLLEGAKKARKALGGGEDDEEEAPEGTDKSSFELGAKQGLGRPAAGVAGSPAPQNLPAEDDR